MQIKNGLPSVWKSIWTMLEDWLILRSYKEPNAQKSFIVPTITQRKISEAKKDKKKELLIKMRVHR